MPASVWRIVPRPGRAADFEALYGPSGEWAEFFQGSPAFQGTLLLRDRRTAGAYLVIDVWDSQASRDAYCAEHGAEYDALDKRGADLTSSEKHLGWFDDVHKVLNAI